MASMYLPDQVALPRVVWSMCFLPEGTSIHWTHERYRANPPGKSALSLQKH